MNKSTRALFAAWIVFSGSIGSPTPCFADTAVTLKPEVEISRYAVRLSDLFIGVPAEIDRDIAQAPPPCKPAIYNEVVLNKLADKYRLDWQNQNAADHAIVTSACTRITGDMIRDAVIEKIKANTETKGRDFDVVFDTRNLEVDLSADQQPNFVLNNFVYDQAGKKFHADLATQTVHGSYVLPLTGHVSVKRNVPILAHRIESGTTLSTADLDWIQIPEERITADIVTESSQLVGRELRRDTAEGEMLHARDIIAPRMVLRGSLVTMRIETPFITVTAQGKAQQDGAQGETIRVINTQSNRTVEGIVTEPGVIEIHTTQRLALAE